MLSKSTVFTSCYTLTDSDQPRTCESRAIDPHCEASSIVNQTLHVMLQAKRDHRVSAGFERVSSCEVLRDSLSVRPRVRVQFVAQILRDFLFKQHVNVKVVKRFARSNKFSYCARGVCLCVHVCIMCYQGVHVKHCYICLHSDQPRGGGGGESNLPCEACSNPLQGPNLLGMLMLES